MRGDVASWTVGAVSGLAVAFTIFHCSQCAPGPARTAAREAVFRVTEELCKELSGSPSSPEEVLLACKAGPGVEEIVKILFPRTEWHAIRARAKAVDAGPGK